MAYVDDLRDQADAVTATLAGVAEGAGAVAGLARGVRSARWARVVLTGQGSSLAACGPAVLRLQAAGLAAWAVETDELLHAARPVADREDTLVVVVSQSGRSAEVVDLTGLPGVRGRVLAVTNNAGSPLAGAAGGVVLTRAGEEATVSCKTYVATLAALAWVAEALCGGDARRVVDELADAIPVLRESAAALTERSAARAAWAAGARHAVFTGRGAGRAAAETGALIVKEAAAFPAQALGTAAFRHGPLELAGPELALVIVENPVTAAFDRRLAVEAAAARACVAVLSPASDDPLWRMPVVPDVARPLVEVLPFQELSVGLARAAGRVPGAFVRATKVTDRR